MARYIATKLGIYGAGRVRPGQEFEGPKGLTGSWFVPVEESAPAKGKKGKAHEAEPQTLSEGAKLVNADLGDADLA